MVAGPQYPFDIDWPANVERMEHVPPADHPAFYGRLRWTLNVTRADMIRAGWSPSVRLFEAAACATPILSDFWSGLTDLLPEGRAIQIARETADVLDTLRRPEEERRRLGSMAQSIVLARHTGLARARELVARIEAATEHSALAAVGS